MFAMVGNIIFIFDIDKFRGFSNSVLTIVDASLGIWDFEIFNVLPDQFQIISAKIFIIVVAITFNIILLNLIVAILANTYSVYDSKSNGLYLSKVVGTRDELNYDESYGAFLSSMPPVNIV
jgi:hypothetical protein